jgi:hypothetical protein
MNPKRVCEKRWSPADAQNRAQVLASLGSFLAEIRLKDTEAHACFLEAHEILNGSPESKGDLAESFLRIGQYQEAREYAVAAFGQEPVGCVLKFLVLASRLLQGLRSIRRHELEDNYAVFPGRIQGPRLIRRGFVKSNAGA